MVVVVSLGEEVVRTPVSLFGAFNNLPRVKSGTTYILPTLQQIYWDTWRGPHGRK